MTPHATGSRQDWLSARLRLLQKEKEITQLNDELAFERQSLPWVRVEKPYAFDTDNGRATLKDLFKGRSQLMVYHFMFGPDYTAGCASCSAIADGFNGIYTHLEHHDVAFTAVSRAPLEKLQAYKSRMGWSFPWASATPSDFNADFSVYFTEAQQREGGIDYNYHREGALPEKLFQQKPNNDSPVQMMANMSGTNMPTYTRERPGMSAFAIEDGQIYHTYSAFSRGLDALWGMYPWLDRAPLGRNEEQGIWWRRHDEYDKPRAKA